MITVEDEELGMPLEGAVVSLRDGRQFNCDKNGEARVNLPDNRQTIVQITYPGYDTRRMNIPAFVEGKGDERFTVSLRLGGVMEARELVVEAQRPQTSETRSGRSVAISERELERTAEIGIIEDVMNSVKLLPGVGYTGMFGALPSIRGGDPGDLMSVFDGFYLERPYHWVGAVSIFDPKMVSNARLSHGVFSSRYGHTISGLLEVTSKSPSSEEVEMETALSTSAASINLSYPLNGKGGVLFMGKVTYWDTFIWLLKGLSQVTDDENLDRINAISTSPYIRSAAVAANYRFAHDLEWRLNAFFGSDGVGADYKTDYDDEGIKGKMEMKADYDNYQGFLISGLTASPTPKLALRFSGGIGFMDTITNDMVNNEVTVYYNKEFLDKYKKFLDGFNSITSKPPLTTDDFYIAPNVNAAVEMESSVFTAQARADADYDLGKGFIAALGVQELYSVWEQTGDIGLNFMEVNIQDLIKINSGVLPPELEALFQDVPEATIIRPNSYKMDVYNQGFTTSAYGLVEYKSPNQRIGAELGLRLDHLYFFGKDFELQTDPALNPRFNIDINIFKNKGFFDSLDISLGSGLFSSIDKLTSFMAPNFNDGNLEIKFNRAWTTVLGIKTDVAQGYSFNIEGYYKLVFDRTYITADTSNDTIKPNFNYDGTGNVWGFDLQLQKLESRYWDGWISYSFNWTKFNNPKSSRDRGFGAEPNENDSDFWFWPSFHRFHNCNVVLNIKPLQWFHIGVRFGFASGTPRNKVGDEIYPYPSLLVKENAAPVIIQKYRRDSWYDENERSAWSLPLDIKVSFFLGNRNGRSNMEIYLAAENLSTLFYNPPGNTTFNEFTGKEDAGGSGTSGFDLPIPMISFGFKWRY
ncbi:MAG: Plug domain-containing protein [Treponema sp.]|nr:Plug domain-containing protein [Treponema sp.]